MCEYFLFDPQSKRFRPLSANEEKDFKAASKCAAKCYSQPKVEDPCGKPADSCDSCPRGSGRRSARKNSCKPDCCDDQACKELGSTTSVPGKYIVVKKEDEPYNAKICSPEWLKCHKIKDSPCETICAGRNSSMAGKGSSSMMEGKAPSCASIQVGYMEQQSDDNRGTCPPSGSSGMCQPARGQGGSSANLCQQSSGNLCQQSSVIMSQRSAMMGQSSSGGMRRVETPCYQDTDPNRLETNKANCIDARKGCPPGNRLPPPVQYGPCGPCKPCGPCDPCGPCGPCDPCGPCGPCGPCDPCAPCGPCDPCGPCNPRLRYVQPARTKICKPSLSLRIPRTNFNCDTVYKKSFYCVDRETAKCCRMPPARVESCLKIPCDAMADETTTSMSFQPNYCMERTKPIFPVSRPILGKGPIQCLTTQKHDFVPKFQYMRTKIMPKNLIKSPCGEIQCDTIHKMSYAPMNFCKRTEPCRPELNLMTPDGPMACETTNNMSYMPVCPPPKEEYSWAKKAKYCAPQVPLACDTVTKLSYSPPGYFVDDCNNCFYDNAEFKNVESNDCFPKAACY